MPTDTLPPTAAQLRLNGCILPCPPGLTLQALLQAQGIDALEVATAVNGQFVPRALRAERALQAGDTVLTFQAIVGG
ncbi:MAG: sulfur carrier protein ThiS [Burkholderiales bacterium]|nr:sulfur carrier protein ThiS [Burkholderiales bacterium]